jgi:hypothetical protein
MANNLPAFKTELLNLFANTGNLDAATKTNLRNAFVTAYPSNWTNYLAANGLTDTPTARGQFAVEMTVIHWRQVVEAESARANQAALPAPNTIA